MFLNNAFLLHVKAITIIKVIFIKVIDLILWEHSGSNKKDFGLQWLILKESPTNIV